MSCIVHRALNNWGAPPSPHWVRRAHAARDYVRGVLTAHLGARAGCWEVRVAGSVLNDTATICSSDVDLHVLRTDRFAYDLPPGPRGDAILATLSRTCECGHLEHRRAIEGALIAACAAAEPRPKALSLPGCPHRLDADVVVGLAYRRYTGHRACDRFCFHEGVELRSRGDDATRVYCFPERRRQRIDAHDRDARGRYRPIVRILKCLRRALRDTSLPNLVALTDGIPSCLLEAILACVPARHYWEPHGCHFPVLARVLPAALQLLTDPRRRATLLDLDGLTPLFAPDKTWSAEHLRAFLEVALRRIQVLDLPLAA